MTSHSTPNLRWLNNRTIVILVALACLIGPVVYVLTAHTFYHTDGFPLDDAWIYQVYARNLAQTGQWSFVVGQPSTGSTSVLWTLLIAPAYVIGIDGRLWTLALGTLTLFATAMAAVQFFSDARPLLRLASGLAIALEWHLVWAAVSGMETMLFAALVMWFWVWLKRRAELIGGTQRDGLPLGLWGGVLALARPEGIVVFGIGALYAAFVVKDWSGRIRLGAVTAGGLAILIVPWLAFNYATSGAIWPNTFAAKQAEYAPLQSVPYISRLVEQLAMVWIGPQLVLIPGLVVAARKLVVRKPIDWVGVLPLVWVLVHLALYAARLPVIYQHARYAIPVIPLLVIFGVHGLGAAVRTKSPQWAIRVGSMAWAATAAALFPAFLVALGAPAYGRDNKFIQDEMVATAKWVDGNTSPDVLIALHDIGALGYYSPHKIVDLAGLVSPDVIDFMNDDQRVAKFVEEEHSDYLIVFPLWPTYSQMVKRPEFCVVWSTDQIEGYVSSSDLGPMTVYRVDPPGGCAAPR